MKTNMAMTSLQAYDELVKTGKMNTIRARVLKCILDFHENPMRDGMTRRSIGAKLNMELGTVAGAVNQLVKLGHVREEGTVIDPRTGKSVKLIKLVRNSRDLFNDHEPDNPMCACPDCINDGWQQQSSLF